MAPSSWSSRGISADSKCTSWRSYKSPHRASRLSSAVPALLRDTIETSTDVCQTELIIWILENNILQRLRVNDHGFFHQSNCYLVYQPDQNSSFSLHVWSGSQSLQADRDAIQLCAIELDRTLGGASIMSFECEGHETASFQRHFQDGIIILEGKSNQPLRSAVKYGKRLYRVQGRKYSSATCNECSVKAASVNEVLILDSYPRMYVWVGQEVDFVLRVRAIKLAKKMRTSQRNGKCHIIVIDQSNKQMSDAFLRKLDSDKQCDLDTPEIITEDYMTNCKIYLYKVNGERVLYDMPFVTMRPLQQKYLTTSDSFLLDMGPSWPLYIWVGNSADPEALYGALQCAENFKQHHSYPYTVPVCRVKEGNETIDFKRTFRDWKEILFSNRQRKTLFSRTDHHTVAKLAECWSNDQFLVGNGTYEMWQVDGDILKLLPQEYYGIFYNCHCYIVLYRENIAGVDQIVIYFWEGSKTSNDCQNETHKLALSMDSLLGHKAVIIRVLDGKEPQHFLTIFQRTIIVYDLDLGQNIIPENNSSQINNHIYCNDTHMFCVYELASECVRISQVSPVSTSLNSAAVFIIISDHITILWYGKKSGAYEREHSKTMMAYFCPTRLHDYDIIIEGGESSKFWSLVQLIGNYPKQFPKPNLQRQYPTLKLCSRILGNWSFIEIPDFSKEDLCDKDNFILDTHDQIQLWIGASVVDKEHEILSSMLQTYIDSDPAGRRQNDLQVLICNQNNEPLLFTKYFRSWDQHGYGGEQACETARKQLRQENASIDIDWQMVNMEYMSTTKISYRDLVKEKDLPADIDLSHKEYYLSDTDFTSALRMTRVQFYMLPMWKQHQILKSARIASH